MKKFAVNDNQIITVFEPDTFTGEQVSINWSAIGSVDIETAEKFAKALQEAIEFAKKQAVHA